MNDLPISAVLDLRPTRDAGYWEALRDRLMAEHDDPSSEARQTFERTYEDLKSTTPGDPASAECLLEIAQFMYTQAESATALQIAELALAHARASANQLVIRRSLNALGIAKNETGDPTGILDFVESIKLARELGCRLSEAIAWNNLGIGLQSFGQYTEAVVCYRKAADIAQDCPDRAPGTRTTRGALRAGAWANVSSAALLSGEYASGLEAAKLSIACNQEPEGSSAGLYRVIAEANAARLALHCNASDAALKHAQSARKFASAWGGSRVDYIVTLCEGLVEAASSAPEAGLKRVAKALDFVRERMPTDVPDALSACIQAHEAAGQSDVALMYVHELLAVNRERRSQQLLATSRRAIRQLSDDVQAPSQQYTNEAAKALELEVAVQRSIDDLGIGAIAAGEQAGHDRFHTFRVGRLAEMFALSEGWVPARAQALGFAARLCDIGMGVIPDTLLRKPRGLSVGERKVLDEHTQFGAEVLTRARLAVLQPCVPVAKFHHERWDGLGTWGLQGEGIPIEARITALADALDSLTHARPWRPAKSFPAALQTIGSEAGTRFDPTLAERFVAFVQREFWKYEDWDEHLVASAHDNDYIKARAQIGRLVKSGG